MRNIEELMELGFSRHAATDIFNTCESEHEDRVDYTFGSEFEDRGDFHYGLSLYEAEYFFGPAANAYIISQFNIGN